MPMKWVPPKVFLRFQDRLIFHVYKENEWDRVMDFWFTTDETEVDEGCCFDVRELEKILNNEYRNPGEAPLDIDFSKPAEIRMLLRAAIRVGALKFPEDQ